MKRFIFAAALCASSTTVLAAASSWSYGGSEGPEFWGELSEKYELCTTGKNQSPINLDHFIEADLKPLEINYSAAGNEILNNGHTIQVNFQPGSTMSLDGHSYELKQFHFHAPSENQIKGESFPLEVHLVHADKEGNLAVVGIMFKEGAENKALVQAWKQMPEKKNAKEALSQVINAEDMLPTNKAYYRFNGSLTTPPCSEGVTWLLMKDPVTVSKEQIEQFTKVMGTHTNRPVQPLNARPVLQ
ncbi:carbonic anhydrase [Endozoicomonas numazuensis]|uniref:Carbonic anhydrase n=1 Tax=Endozoicomonas numazuensis TaxID=1137799 RepID=A0A081NEE4_9GAMM|nr:carbonic anhydrase [Endozoicomonas numazuensis]KEQ16817.1 hypothetical protein GZ78_19285 [Endozoicomonas numazuensis]